eukprot:symbB.v1.2.013472.t1/scaffold951.1/size304340/12
MASDRFARWTFLTRPCGCKDSVKQANFHDTRMNFFKSSLDMDPMSFKEFVEHERSRRFPEGDDVVSIPMSSTSCHARSNTVHSTWKLDGSHRADILECETCEDSKAVQRSKAHQAPTELEVWLTAMVYVPWIFFCWRDSEQLENHYAVTFYASCGWAVMSLSSLFSVLYQDKYPDAALGILMFGNFVFAVACLYFYGYHWTRMWRHFTQNRFRPLWIPGLLGLMCLHLLTPFDLMKRLDDPGWWKTVCSVYNDEWWWVADVRIIELFVTAAALLLIILHIQDRRGDRTDRRSSPRRNVAQRRPSSAPVLRQRRSEESQDSTSWSIGTLFCKERHGGHLKRGSAATFRRPKSATVAGAVVPPHQRPVFLVGDNGVDPKDCVDIHNPRRFSSIERTFTLRGIRHLDPVVPVRGYGGSLQRPSSSYSSSSSGRTISDFAPIAAFRPVIGTIFAPLGLMVLESTWLRASAWQHYLMQGPKYW